MRYLFLLLALPLFGAYIGNPATPAIMNTGIFSTNYSFFKFTSGYIYDYTYDKRYTANDQVIKQFGLLSQQGSFSLILLERLQLYGSSGTSKEMVENKSIYEEVFTINTNAHFSFSVGARLILLKFGQTFLTLDGSYFNVPSSEKSYFKYLNQLNLPIGGEKQKFAVEEWQANIGLASKIFFLTPYGGVNYLQSTLDAEKTYHNEVKWGFFYGLTLSLTGRLHLNFERRVRDEFAYSFATIAVF